MNQVMTLTKPNDPSIPARKFARLIEVARALKLTKQEGPSFHVSFILKGAKPIVIGTNSYTKRNMVSLRYKATKHDGAYVAGVHSEMDSLGKIKYQDQENLTLVNIRIDNNGNLANSCPCPNCAYVLGRTPSIKKIFYSTSAGDFKRFP